ncbi:hypothetical protein R9C00_09855 [Flammeovirgaceae bacterium SG7u.111]|nr:hypothetical protein [Flammeovirgaceae bacterium SG7u.132]WPO37755.1 hypothetical protein R9C00_09855 [Flammeovirgaceae bacterium SG7u.111]
MKFLIPLLLLLSSCSANAQLPKEQVIENINRWYSENPEKYSLKVKGDKASAFITRYHPERPEEKDDIIEISYEGMVIQLVFYKPLEEMTTHRDSLEKYCSFLALDDIYNEIPSKGWNIYPRTPISSIGSEAVEFISGGNSISLKINWSSYTVMGYKDSDKCNEELSIADSSISDDCYVSVRKKLPLEVVITNVPFDK